ncbi:MAG: dTDP-4-dehydrorhamnose reductase [Alphaproteobacteria bacterium]|nr:dTDP-4-dehydrorhamnose reductase [Alphaproteobacteria bacterium]
MRKKILVLGANGQIGQEIMRLPPPDGVEIYGRSRAEFDVTASPASFMDILQGCDAVINCAAYTKVDEAEIRPDLAQQINAESVMKLAMEAAKTGTIILHLSTDFVFDGKNEGKAYLEQDIAHPINIYGLSKWRGEEALRHSHARHIILRTAWVFGAYGHNFVKAIMRQADAGRDLSVVNDQIGCPTPAQDIAATLVQMAETVMKTATPHFGTYHYVGEPVVSWYDFAAAILAEFYPEGRRPQLSPRSSAGMTGAIRPAWSVLDCRKIYRDYGIRQPNWREKLAQFPPPNS